MTNISATAKRSVDQAGVKGAKCTILQKSGFDTKKSLTHRNNQDSHVKLLVVMYLHWCFLKRLAAYLHHAQKF